MKSSLLITFSLLLFQTAFSQTPTKALQGRVFAEQTDVTGVVVRNINSRQATITDGQGNFSIPVKRNDTLIFLAVQFKNKVLPITEALYGSQYINVPLEDFVNELDEVVVRPYDLTGDIDQDLQNLKLEKDVSAEALGLPNAQQEVPSQSRRKLQQATFGKFHPGMLLSPPLDPIINAITGRTKMLKNRVAVDEKYGQTQDVQASFEDRLFTDALKIPKEKIDDFMYFCEVDENFDGVVLTNDHLQIWEFLRNKSTAYRKNNGLE